MGIRRILALLVLLVVGYALMRAAPAYLPYLSLASRTSPAAPGSNVMGVAVYPGARQVSNASSGDSGAADYLVRARPEAVVRFYTDACRAASPLVWSAPSSPRAAATGSAETLLVWQDRQRGYTVLVSPSSTIALLTCFQIQYAAIGLGPARAAAETPAAAAPPLDLPLYPGGTVDYAGTVRGENGRIATARLQVAGSSTAVADYYQRLARTHAARAGGRSVCGTLIVRAASSWDDAGDRYTAAMLCPSPAFPAVIWLQRAEGEATAAARQHHPQEARARARLSARLP